MGFRILLFLILGLTAVGCTPDSSTDAAPTDVSSAGAASSSPASAEQAAAPADAAACLASSTTFRDPLGEFAALLGLLPLLLPLLPARTLFCAGLICAAATSALPPPCSAFLPTTAPMGSSLGAFTAAEFGRRFDAEPGRPVPDADPGRADMTKA